MSNITTTIYKPEMKMSELIDANYQLLLLLDRINFALGFSEKSVERVCRENQFDTNCFLFLANLQSGKLKINIEEEFNKLPLEPFLDYLKSSHSYFLEQRLPNIRRKLELVFSDSNKDLHDVVLGFFDKYVKEVLEHMTYEDTIVFPYVDALMENNKKGKRYSIDTYEAAHTDIEGKMNDLKQILLKYISNTHNRGVMINVLMEIYTTGEELQTHQFLEDDLVIPRVKRIEQRLKTGI